MSSDTMFINSARLLPTENRKVKQLQRPDRKKHTRGSYAAQKQQLPNGEQPNFGHGQKQSKKRGSGRQKGRDGATGAQANVGLTEDLKQLLSIPSGSAGSGSAQRDASGRGSSAGTSADRAGSVPAGGPAGKGSSEQVPASSAVNGIPGLGLQTAQVPFSSPVVSHPMLAEPAAAGAVLSAPFPGHVAGYLPCVNSTRMQYPLHASNNIPVSQPISPYPPQGFQMHPPPSFVGLPVAPMYPQYLSAQNQSPQQQAACPMPVRAQQPIIPTIAHNTLPCASSANSTSKPSVRSKGSPGSEGGSRRSQNWKGSQNVGYAGATFATDQPALSSLPKPSFV
ncbi:AaceriAFR231Wp [[Ashbya] aceris (nom. inval.)]|nr:AaceriAFR231Wp [[Ashbya] aceris (nom. inval.)]